jgi:signal transduction histidine kinase
MRGRLARKDLRLRGRYLSFLTHEINNPVASLNMTALNLVQGVFGAVPEEFKPWFSMLREQTARLAALVGDLRDLVHIEFHEDFAIELSLANPEEVLKECLNWIREAYERAGTELRVEGFSGLPPARMDSDRIGRVICAALWHARKFRLKGPVAVRGKSGGGRLSLSVEYEGMPMSQEAALACLDLYAAARNPDSQVLVSTGAGLGLARRIVEAHRGRLSFSVSPDGLSRIEIDLPIS